MNLFDEIRRRRAHLISGAHFNRDQTRFYMPTRDGIACYTGMQNAEGKWQGKLAGFAASEHDAKRFLEGMWVPLRKANTRGND